MTIDDCIKHFGTIYKAAEKIGVSRQAACHWIKNERIPFGSQYKIEKATKGALIAQEEEVTKEISSKYRSTDLKETRNNLADFMLRLSNLSQKYGVIIKEGTILHWKEIPSHKNLYKYDFVKLPIEDAKDRKICNIARLGRFDYVLEEA